jgi:predicted component of type VI protein secretion system
MGFGQMQTLLGFILGGAFDVRLQLTIGPQDVPSSMLEKTGFMRLGWTAWLTSRPRSSPGVVTIVLCTGSGKSEAWRCATSSVNR